MIKAILSCLLAINICIAAHESGHFIAARLYSIPIAKFTIGLPVTPSLLTLKHGETEFSLNLLPLGGYVSLRSDLSPAIAEKRLALAFGGPIASLIFGISLVFFGSVDRFGNVRHSFLYAMEAVVKISKSMWRTLLDTLNFRSSNEIIGFTDILSYSERAATMGFRKYCLFVGTLSITVAIINLLPIPPLDGFHALYAVVEMQVGQISGKIYSFLVTLGILFFIVSIVLNLLSKNKLVGYANEKPEC